MIVMFEAARYDCLKAKRHKASNQSAKIYYELGANEKGVERMVHSSFSIFLEASAFQNNQSSVDKSTNS